MVYGVVQQVYGVVTPDSVIKVPLTPSPSIFRQPKLLIYLLMSSLSVSQYESFYSIIWVVIAPQRGKYIQRH